MSKKHPLEETFNIKPASVEVLEEQFAHLDIPENPELDDITRLALEAYRDQMKDIMCMEPKYRSRALEVAQTYLNLAKESLTKNEELTQKREKLDKDLGKDKEGEEDEEESFSRKSLLMEIDNSRKNGTEDK